MAFRISPALAPALVVLSLTLGPAPGRADAISYRTPPRVVADILTAPRLPRRPASVSPDGARLIVPDTPSLIPIAVLAEPVEKLAGLEILPAMHCTRNQLKAALSGFRVVAIANGRAVRAQLPANARIGALAWSNRGDRVACALYANGGAELWIVDAATGTARRIEGVALNTVLDPSLEWTLDDREILVLAVVPDVAAPAPPARVPAGPVAREATGKAAPQRTSRDVLRTADDQARFAFWATSRLTRVPVAGGAPRPVGDPGPLATWSVSPDERHLVLERFVLPAPLGFPWYLFPRSVEIRGVDGSLVARLGDIPLNDRSAISSVARLGPRGWSWSGDGRSLWYFDWKDTPGADALKAIRDTTLPQPGVDRLMRLDEPFTGKPVEVATSDYQMEQMLWTENDRHLVIADGYQPRRRVRAWWVDPASRTAARKVLFERSAESVYDDPGEPLRHRVRHRSVMWTAPDGRSIYLSGDGYRPDGQRPFLDRRDLSGPTVRVFESDAGHLESAVTLLAGDASAFLTLRQSAKEPPNYFLHQAKAKKPRALSDYPDPAPALSASKRVRYTFMRPDSVKLSAEAVLPADWKEGERLPTVFWVYPEDYRSAAAASQNRTSVNHFPSQSTLNPEVLVTQGYAVVRPNLAVLGSNDRYVEEIRRSARAAIDEAVRRGFCDPDRIAVGGHSYGAFSTVNLLAHTDFFKAGWASDGAYNRTLTPFTFQAEERTLWEARDTYLAMSPFLYASDIKSPLLLFHDLDDTNVGTFPLQSERMFEAMNGLGKVCALVEYPYEDHVPVARESVLDYWARVLDWLDRYVKGGGPVAAPPPGEHGE